jgi:hypothetical protein
MKTCSLEEKMQEPKPEPASEPEDSGFKTAIEREDDPFFDDDPGNDGRSSD